MAAYLPNAILLEEIIKCKEAEKLSQTAIDMFNKIANEFSKTYVYKNPMDKQDCISRALEDMIKYWNRFNPERSKNAFAYFTQIAKNGMTKGFNELYHKKLGPMVSISEDGIFNI